MQVMLKEMLITILLLAGVALASRLIAWLWRNVFRKIALKTPTKLDLMLFEATEKPVSFLVLIVGFYFVLRRLSILFTDSGCSRLVSEAFYVLMVFVVTYFVYAVMRALADWYILEVASRTETKWDDEFVPLFKRLIKIVIIFIAATVVLSHFKVNIAGFVATAGIASLAVALAAQETLANTISGFIILIDRPFRVGDRIELSSGEMGDVQEIGLRSTKILSFDNTIIVVPNSEIAKSRLVNYGYPDAKVKVRQTISVAYGSDMVKVKKILIEICSQHRDILKDPLPSAYFSEFGESSLNILLIYWVSDYRDKFRIVDEVNMEIKERFEREKIEIPFPQRDIHLRSGGFDKK